MDVTEILKGVIHPETGKDIVSMGMVENVTQADGDIRFTIRLAKTNDPAAGSVRRAAEAMVREATGIDPVVIMAEPAKHNRPAKETEKKASPTEKIKKIIAVASGKGGVGKSTVTANLAVALHSLGYSVGILDADIYGPSMPKMFGIECYQPPFDDRTELIKPAESMGIGIMSIGFFITADDALVWRGPMATSALRQLMHQCDWGELDFLLVDLPPGTGDVHLTVVSEMKVDAALIVTTPQKVALLDVGRGIRMFGNENIAVPVIGLVNNMAWFTPAELPDNRYYIFGKGETEKISEQLGIPILAEIPLVQGIAESGDNGRPVADEGSATAMVFKELAEKTAKAVES